MLLRRLFVIATLALLTPAAAFAQLLWAEGTHYARIGPLPAPGVPAGKIAVTEVFSYACPHCYEALPAVQKIKAALPADAVLTYLPAGFNPSAGWPMFQRAFLTAQALGISESQHEPFFRSIWDSYEFPFVDRASGRMRQPLPTIEDAARFFTRGTTVTEAQFLARATSPEMDTLVQQTEALVRNWRIPSTPAFVVNGRYLINSSAVGGWPQITSLINYLVSLERARLRTAKPAPAAATPAAATTTPAPAAATP